MADSSIQINGGLGKIAAGVVVILLAAGVVGIWNMNSKISTIGERVEWLVKQVDSNTDRLNQLYGGGR